MSTSHDPLTAFQDEVETVLEKPSHSRLHRLLRANAISNFAAAAETSRSADNLALIAPAIDKIREDAAGLMQWRTEVNGRLQALEHAWKAQRVKWEAWLHGTASISRAASDQIHQMLPDHPTRLLLDLARAAHFFHVTAHELLTLDENLVEAVQDVNNGASRYEALYAESKTALESRNPLDLPQDFSFGRPFDTKEDLHTVRKHLDHRADVAVRLFVMLLVAPPRGKAGTPGQPGPAPQAASANAKSGGGASHGNP
jgi:hypothetical protein